MACRLPMLTVEKEDPNPGRASLYVWQDVQLSRGNAWRPEQGDDVLKLLLQAKQQKSQAETGGMTLAELEAKIKSYKSAQASRALSCAESGAMEDLMKGARGLGEGGEVEHEVLQVESEARGIIFSHTLMVF